eukprot:768396-Hanusia_phi.AAC.5
MRGEEVERRGCGGQGRNKSKESEERGGEGTMASVRLYIFSYSSFTCETLRGAKESRRRKGDRKTGRQG